VKTHGLKLDRPAIFFDLETTGADIAKDRIVSIAVSKLTPDGSREDKYMLVNPGMPIPAEATAVHGITDEMVKDSPRFHQIAKSLHAHIDGLDLAGFNIKGFDIPLLAEEFSRVGLDFPRKGIRVFDALGIFMNMERRRLQDAVKFYCGREITDAHNAAGDVESTIDVMTAQVERYGFDTPEAIELHGRGQWDGEELVMRELYDPAGKLYLDDDGDVCYNFGKAKDTKVKVDPGFGNWMLKQEFIPRVTKSLLLAYFSSNSIRV
jgi:DNA polymerase-3 subunit epsilon